MNTSPYKFDHSCRCSIGATPWRWFLSGNSAAGVEGDAGAQIIVNNSIITNNNIGVQSSFSVRLSNNDIAFNNTAISGGSGTFGNNRFSGNVSPSTSLLGYYLTSTRDRLSG